MEKETHYKEAHLQVIEPDGLARIVSYSDVIAFIKQIKVGEMCDMIFQAHPDWLVNIRSKPVFDLAYSLPGLADFMTMTASPANQQSHKPPPEKVIPAPTPEAIAVIPPPEVEPEHVLDTAREL